MLIRMKCPCPTQSDGSPFIIVGGIRCDEEELWCKLGGGIEEAKLLELEGTHELIRATRPAAEEGTDPNGIAFEINSGKRRGWSYGWNANAGRGVTHRFWVICLKKSAVDNSILECVASAR
jgi:hypothetical protein